MQIFIKNDRTIVADIDQDASTDDLREIILMKFVNYEWHKNRNSIYQMSLRFEI
jgi:hypothetical protein